MNRRTALALVLLGVALSVAIPAMGSLLSGGKDAGRNVAFDSTNGPNVSVGEPMNFTTQNPWQETQQITLEPYGNFSSNGDTHVRVDRWNGTWTNLSQLDVSSADLTVDPNDKPPVTVGGNADALSYRETMSVGDGQVDFEYAGTSGTTTITLRDLPVSTTIAAIDDDTNAVLAVATTDGNGHATFDGMPNSEHNVVLQTSEGGPTVDTAAARPQGDLNDSKAVIEVPVSDPDLPDDEVNVTLYLDGTKLSSTNITSNTTVSETRSGLTGGNHTWRVVATDSYGQSTSHTFEFKVPDTLYIRNVSDHSLVTGSTATIQLFGSGATVERQTSDGTYNLSGLAVSEPMVASVEATGYYQRELYLKSIHQQQTIYLLPSGVSTNTIRFTLDDKTGDFPSEESVLYVTRGVPGDGTNEYKIVTSSQFGVQGVTEELVTGQQYRLVVEGPDGDRRVLGSFTPTVDETVPLTIGRVNITGSVQGGVAFGATTTESQGQGYVRYQYRDAEDATDSLRVRIYNESGGSRTLVYDATNSEPGESVTATIPVNTTDAQFEVVYNASRDGSPDHDGVAYAGNVPTVGQGLGLDPTVRSLLGMATIIAVMGLLVILDSALASGITVGTAGFLTMTGFIQLHPIQLGIAGVIALLYLVGLPGRP